MNYPACLFINGERIERTAASRLDVVNPAREEVIGSAPTAGPAEVADAIEAAQRGFAAWRRTSAFERANVLRRIAGLMRERGEEIATLMTAEVGKPIGEARAEVNSAAEYFGWAAEETRRIATKVRNGRLPESVYEISHEPVGIVLALTAWNYPIALPARKLSSALAAGCAVILRPAEEAPACVSLLIQCCHDGGLPRGAVNLLHGRPDAVVVPLMAEPRIRKVSFTGSTRVGQLLIQQSAQTVKRLTMELGGHAPVLVLKDADLGTAAIASALGKFRNAGQVCTAPTRFYVDEAVVAEFTDRFVDLARRLRIGDGLDASTQMGPLTTERQRERAERMVEDARARGARILTGGNRPQGFNRGYFYEPTIIDEVPPDALMLREEPFSPIAAILPFRELDEAIERSNASEFALAAYVFSQSANVAEGVAARLDAGVIGVNTVAVAAPEAPFGGVKQSGYGREGGEEGIHDYLNCKFVHKVKSHL